MSSRIPAVIGEAATHPRGPFDHRLGGPGSRARSARLTLTLRERLEWFERQGYREVFLWSASHYPPEYPTPAQRETDWSLATQRQVRAYTNARAARPK